MEFSDLITDTRYLINDINGEVWTDEALTRYLNEAQREYCRRTQCLRNCFSIMPNEDGEYILPTDIINIKYAFRADYMPLFLTNERRLNDCYGGDLSNNGNSDYLYLTGEFGKYNLYPVPDVTVEAITMSSNYGVVEYTEDITISGDYGVLDIYSIVESGLNLPNAVGTIQYSYIPADNKIMVRIPEALMWYAGAKCYEERKPQQNIKKSEIFFQQFSSLISKEVEILKKHKGKHQTGEWK